MLLKRQIFFDKNVLFQAQRSLAKNKCEVLGSVSDVRSFCGARIKKKKKTRLIRTRQQWQLVKKFEELSQHARN